MIHCTSKFLGEGGSIGSSASFSLGLIHLILEFMIYFLEFIFPGLLYALFVENRFTLIGEIFEY